jgi:Zn-dependent protease with chaperone function
MIAALLVLLYSVTVAWSVPSVLVRFTAGGTSARLGLAVWLTAMVSVLGSACIALGYLVQGAVAGWTQLAEVVCRSVSDGTCAPVVYRSALLALGLGIAAVLATFTAAVLSCRCGHRLRDALRQTRSHAEAARIAGRRLSGEALSGEALSDRALFGRALSGRALSGRAPASLGTVVLDVPQLAAYCAPPATIVVTSGALGILAPAQLGAVLAHERAHLAGRHHLLIAVTRGLAATFPAVPLFSRGRTEVARLAEMAADDAAARRAGRRPLIEALLAIGTGAPVSASTVSAGAVSAGAGALGMASYAVAARVERLLAPPRRATLAGHTLALVVTLAALTAVTGLVAVLAGTV